MKYLVLFLLLVGCEQAPQTFGEPAYDLKLCNRERDELRKLMDDFKEPSYIEYCNVMGKCKKLARRTVWKEQKKCVKTENIPTYTGRYFPSTYEYDCDKD